MPPTPGRNDVRSRFPDLLGRSLRLSELDASGLAEMYAYSHDPAFYEYLEFPPHRSIEDTASYIEKLCRRMEDGNAHYWFVRRKVDDAIVGSFGVHSIDWRKGSAEIGYGIAPAHWGRGYFSEAARLVLDHLFRGLHFYRVTATTVVSNLASTRGLERLGFEREGVFRGYYLTEAGERLDAGVYALLRDDYFRRSASEQTNE